MLTVIEDFEAGWTNYIAGESVHQVRQFKAGERYAIQARRPEGVSVDGFFLFEKYLKNCQID